MRQQLIFVYNQILMDGMVLSKKKKLMDGGVPGSVYIYILLVNNVTGLVGIASFFFFFLFLFLAIS